MRVQVVYALPERCWFVDLDMPAGATVRDAIRESGITEAAGLPPDADAGIWGEVVERDRRLRDGDRVELYRPLEQDPREARRRLAEAAPARRARR